MMQKGKIDGKMVDIIKPEEYYANPSLYPYNYTAFDPGNGTIYPLRSKLDSRPGWYMSPTSPLIKQKDPEPEEIGIYSTDNIVNFDDVATMSDIIHRQNLLTNQERTILESVDNVFAPPIKPDDRAEMIAMKQMVHAKNCDIDKYEHRFGKKNFQNEKRLFERPSMTLSKIVQTCQALDVKATLILEDASNDVPNPMNKIITVTLTGADGDMEDSDE